MKKNYVLDANVLLHDPHAIFKFEDNDVIIPIFAIEEIDKFKHEGSERGRNARTIARLLDSVRRSGDSLAGGVPFESGGSLRIAIPERRPALLVGLDTSSQDHAILQTAIDIRDRDKEKPTIFVTMDTNLRIRADALGVVAETYENQRVEDPETTHTVVEIEVPGPEVDAFFQHGYLSGPTLVELLPNAAVLLRDASAASHTALGRYDAARGHVTALRVPREGVMGVRPRNKEQAFALDLLLDDSVRLVTLMGKAGTGKTLLAIAAGLKRTTEDGVYTKLLVSRPIMPLGRDIGFLPGDVEEKLNPWMQPVFDNLEFLLSHGDGKPGREQSTTMVELLESGVIQVEPLTYIRGRSLPHQYLIIDEAQNLTPHEVKTIVTRCGEGTKIILTGDPHQIDNPYVDHATNGLSVAAERFKRERIAGHVVLSKGERSELAELAANLL
ncbi:PhoH family protein [Chondromyces apiculatus]|uniref:Phosphate starvation-inducible protein PhoH putative ATPase n=1 Tax=Chondromyces apiculatus DSM 436 TaxID=1192034 RepID=A0A017T697_9BACT|nr:PhoH family protein [Chondromyces apiculatus]EYF04325.1 phosphate starvation-inducible protein PhoH putative ATPase [Chondromyces apiculatus DSM 436]